MTDTALRRALADYEREVERLESTIEAALVPGLPAQEIVDTLSAAGIEPIDALVQWFQFGNGRRPEPPLHGVFDNLMLVSVDEAVELRATLQTDGTLEVGNGGWLPIAGGKPTVVVRTAAQGQGAVREYWWDEPPRDSDPSLAAWVERQLGILRSRGLWQSSPWEPCLEVSFHLGETALDRRGQRQLSNVILRINALNYQRVRLQHSGRDSLAGNDGLEQQQVDLVRRRLIEAGVAADVIESETMPPSADENVHAHTIFLSCRIDR